MDKIGRNIGLDENPRGLRDVVVLEDLQLLGGSGGELDRHPEQQLLACRELRLFRRNLSRVRVENYSTFSPLKRCSEAYKNSLFWADTL